MQQLTVIGATGKLAIPTIHRLVENGVVIKAVVRNVQKAQQQLPKNVKIVQADLQDVKSLKKALAGTAHLYLNLSSEDPNADFVPEVHGIQNIITAADKSCIRQIIQISGLGAYRADFHIRGEMTGNNALRAKGFDLVKESGIPHTRLHASWFLDALPWFIKDNILTVMGQHSYPLYWTNTTDFADLLTNAIGNEIAFDKDYAVQGKDGIPFGEAARRFVAAALPEVKLMEIPITPELGHFGQFMQYFADFKEQLIGEEAWRDLGTPKLTLEDFAKRMV